MTGMASRRKLYLGLFVLVIGGTALAVLGATTGNGLWFVLLAVLFVGTAVFLMNIRCARCGYPVLKRERKTAIGHLTVWVSAVPSHCRNCGRRLVAGWPTDTAPP